MKGGREGEGKREREERRVVLTELMPRPSIRTEGSVARQELTMPSLTPYLLLCSYRQLTLYLLL